MNYDFTQQDVDKAIKIYLRRMFIQHTYSPVDKPTLYLLGGQPGAGKSTISDRLMEEHPNAIFINSDTFHELHPKYQEIKEELKSEYIDVTGKFAGEVNKKIVQTLSDQKYNLIIEGTFHSLETPKQITQALQSKGYTAELHALAVPRDISYVGTLSRYFVGKIKGTGRAVNKEYYDSVAEKFPVNLKSLAESGMFQSMHLHTRDKEIFSTERDADSFMKQFHREVGRRLDLVQEKDLAESLDFINRSLSNEEKNGVTTIERSPIKEIRKELQAIQKSRNIGMVR